MPAQTKLERATELAEELNNTDNPDDEQWDVLLEALKQTYMFFVTNTEGRNGEQYVNYTLWVRDGIDFPVVNSQTGGVAGFHSQSTDIGAKNSQTPSDEFFELIGTAFHEAMCFMPDIYFRSVDDLTIEDETGEDTTQLSDEDRKELRLKERYTTAGHPDDGTPNEQNTHFDNTVDLVYENSNPADIEVWMAMKLIEYMTSPNGKPLNELKPLMLWAANHTDFGVPALRQPGEENTEPDNTHTTA